MTTINDIYKLNEIGTGYSRELDFDEMPDTKQFFNTRPTHIAALYSISDGVYFSTNKEGSNVYIKLDTSQDEDHMGMTIVLYENENRTRKIWLEQTICSTNGRICQRKLP